MKIKVTFLIIVLTFTSIKLFAQNLDTVYITTEKYDV
jgi:hypothetical protein